MSRLALITDHCTDGDFTDKRYYFHIKEACCNNYSIDPRLQTAVFTTNGSMVESLYQFTPTGISYYYSKPKAGVLPWSVDISFRLYKSKLKHELLRVKSW
jgi:hypothetical protein